MLCVDGHKNAALSSRGVIVPQYMASILTFVSVNGLAVIFCLTTAAVRTYMVAQFTYLRSIQ